MATFEPDKFIAVWMVGGPLDGTVYGDMPVFSDGKPAERAAIPQAGPKESGLYAVYRRRPEIWVDGRWYYDFVEEVANPTPAKPQPFPNGTVVGTAPGPTAAAPQAENAKPSDSEDLATSGQEPEFHAAPRFVQAQAWWIASEVARRTSRLCIREEAPMDGFYYGLSIIDSAGSEPPRKAFLNFGASFHFFGGVGRDRESRPWAQALSAESPHEMVKLVESAMGWQKKGADATTDRSLTYRVLAACLWYRINDRHRWVVTNGVPLDSYDAHPPPPAFLAEFDDVADAVRQDADELWRYWLLERADRRVAVLNEHGVLFRRGLAPVELMPIYRRRRRLDDVVAVVLEEGERL